MTAGASFSRLSSRCGGCRGLCCSLLCFAQSEGFPVDKEAGVPCPHLLEDARCSVHSRLADLGLRGCAAFECFGAGPAVSALFPGHTPAPVLIHMFGVARQLCQTLWYLAQAEEYEPSGPAGALAREGLAALDSPQALDGLDLTDYQGRANRYLRLLHRRWYPGGQRRRQYLGADLRAAPMADRDLSMALLLAADLRRADLSGSSLLGADLRDADLRGADLSGTRFLTQFQLGSARGDRHTRLPPHLVRPSGWT